MAENRELAQCSVCTVMKPRTAFNLSRTITRGISNRCRECGKAYMRLWRTKNREHVERYAKNYNKSHADKRSETFKAWYLRNVKRQREKALARRNTDLAAARQKCLDWCARNKPARQQYRKDNRLLYRASWQRRRARERAAEGSWTPKDIESLMLQQGGRCAYCRNGLKSDFQVDHVIPLAKGGTNWPANLALACPSCNRRKNTRTDMKPIQEVSNG